jgi:glucan biosynthesis protein C
VICVSDTSRRTDLDWLRVGAFAGLIFYHEALLYEHSHRAVSLVMLVTHPWRMSLLFLISGAATRYMADGVSARRLSAERTLRLLPPLIFAVLFLVPIQAYLTLLQTTAYAEGFDAFLRTYVSMPARAEVARQFNYTLPVYGHLWFVFYLWAYTLVLTLGLGLGPGAFAWAQRRLERISAPALLVWPFIILATLRLMLFPRFGVTLGFSNDWYNHLVCAGMFLLGFLMARSERVWVHLVRARWAGLCMAAVGLIAYGCLVLYYGLSPEWAEAGHPAMGVLYDLERWGAMVAVLGFGRLHLASRRAPALRYLNGGIFTAYIVHEPVLLALKHALAPMRLNIAVEVGLLTLGALGACFIAYELARRVRWLGVALGQRRLTLSWDAWRRPAHRINLNRIAATD